MKTIVAEIRTLFSGSFGKNTFYVYIAQIVGGGLGFLFNLVLIRKMNVQDYGLFTLFSSAAMLLAGFFPLGWTETYNRFGSKHIHDEYFFPLRKFFLKRILVSTLVCSAVAFMFSGWISSNFYHRPDFDFYLKVSIFSAIILCLYSFVSVDLQVRHRFKDYLGSQVFLSAARLLLVLGAVGAAVLTLPTAIAINVLIPAVLVLFLGWTMGAFSPSFWRQSGLSPEIEAESASFRKWILVSALCNAVIGNIDLSILAHFHPDQTLAQYGVAARLTLPIQMAMASLGIVLLPKIASTKDPEVTRRQLGKLVRYLLPAGAVLLVLSFLIPPVLARWAGGAYAESEDTIRFFLFSSVIVFVTNPAGIFLIAWGHVRLNAILNLVQLIVDIALDLLWIPEKGALGAIQATCVVYLMGTAFAYYFLWRAMNGKLKPYESVFKP